MRILYRMAKSLKKSVKKLVKNKSRRTKNRFSRKGGKRRNGGGEEDRKVVQGIATYKEESPKEESVKSPSDDFEMKDEKIFDTKGHLIFENNKKYLYVDGVKYEFKGKVVDGKPSNESSEMINPDGIELRGYFDNGIPSGWFVRPRQPKSKHDVYFMEGKHYYNFIPNLGRFIGMDPNKGRRILQRG